MSPGDFSYRNTWILRNFVALAIIHKEDRLHEAARTAESGRRSLQFAEGARGHLFAQLPLPSVMRLGGGASVGSTVAVADGEFEMSNMSSSVFAFASRSVRLLPPRKRFSMSASMEV